MLTSENCIVREKEKRKNFQIDNRIFHVNTNTTSSWVSTSMQCEYLMQCVTKKNPFKLGENFVEFILWKLKSIFLFFSFFFSLFFISWQMLKIIVLCCLRIYQIYHNSMRIIGIKAYTHTVCLIEWFPFP